MSRTEIGEVSTDVPEASQIASTRIGIDSQSSIKL